MSDKGTTGKGRPTPKRRDAQPRRGGPVAPPPLTRREAAQRLREQGKAKRQDLKTTRRSGNPVLFKRDQGPVRALVRDVVDSRRHVSVLLLPAAVLPLLGQSTGSPAIYQIATTLWLAAILAAFVDFTSTVLAVKRRVREEFPEDPGKGHGFYAVMRTSQFRRLRNPKPQVQVGEQV